MILVDQDSAAGQEKPVRRQQGNELRETKTAAERPIPTIQLNIMPVGSSIEKFREKKSTAYSGSMTSGRNRDGDALFVFCQLEQHVVREFCGQYEEHFGQKVDGRWSQM